MGRKNRGYKKGEPFRDARLFVIACEGAKREKEYFETLVEDNRRVKIKILASDGEKHGKSSPKWVMSRAAEYEEEIGLAEDDQLWLVMDTDRWEEKELREIIKHCQEIPSWKTAISNPCFEVWLYLHLADLATEPVQTCSELKRALHQMVKGGYKAGVFLKQIEEAIQRARTGDEHPEHDLPEPMITKVYLLAKAILEFL